MSDSEPAACKGAISKPAEGEVIKRKKRKVQIVHVYPSKPCYPQ